MDRDIPIFNRPVMEKIFKKNQELHRKRLTNIMVQTKLFRKATIIIHLIKVTLFLEKRHTLSRKANNYRFREAIIYFLIEWLIS